MLNRRRFIVGAALIAAAVSYLVYAGIRTTSMYYFELSEFVARRDALLGETLRVKGWVKQGSVSWDAHTNELAFELATKDGGSPVPVAYRGIRPDMFSEGREVVVEGVESKEAWDLLLSMGCDVAQGYFLSRPLPAAELERWVRTSPWSRERASA